MLCRMSVIRISKGQIELQWFIEFELYFTGSWIKNSSGLHSNLSFTLYVAEVIVKYVTWLT